MFSRRIWCLINMDAAWTLTDLTQSEVHAIVATLSDEHREKTRVWKKGWDQWKSLYDKETQFLLEPWLQKTQPPPPPVILKKEFPPVNVETIVTTPLPMSRAVIQRKYTRHMVTIPVKIIQGPSEFMTTTQNVSYGGMLLKDKLPGWVAGYCAVEVQISPTELVEMVCSVVEDQTSDKFRLEVDQTRPNPQFQAWIESLETSGSKKIS